MGRQMLRAGFQALETTRMPLGEIVLAGALTLMAIPAANAHPFLKQALPAAGSTVSHAPRQVSLWFTESIEPAFSKAVVRNARGKDVDRGHAHLARGKHAELQIALKPLPPGTYKVTWHVLSVDTHKTHGSFSFTVARQ